jgi:hypothetical protein
VFINGVPGPVAAQFKGRDRRQGDLSWGGPQCRIEQPSIADLPMGGSINHVELVKVPELILKWGTCPFDSRQARKN